MADGSIIAAVIVTQTPTNQPSVPRSVPGPASIPRIRTSSTAQAASVAPSSAAKTSGRSALTAVVFSLEVATT